MYEWVDETWNPLAGECPHGCSYCSTHKLAQRWQVVKNKYLGEPRIDQNAIVKNLKGNPKVIFVVGQNDLFADGVTYSDIWTILERCMAWNQHTYLFQTKNPGRMIHYLRDIPHGSILCTTIETNRHYPEHMGAAPKPIDRAEAMSQILDFRKFVTIEPIMDFDLDEMVSLIRMCRPEQVNIGADSGHNNLPEPSKDKLLALISELQKFTTIANKSNLERILNSNQRT